jgi:hypothetical protein
VGWNIDIRSEEEIKREVTEQMGALIASGESVPLSVIEGVTVQQTDALAEHDINDIDALAQTSVDDLVEFLDVSLDEAENILSAAQAVVAMRDKTLQEGEAQAGGEEGEAVEQHAASAEFDENIEAGDVEPSREMTAAGYDEAVENGIPFRAEADILAQESADPVALTEAEAFSEDELVLQEAGRDLRPDTITPSPDVTSSGAAALESVSEFVSEELIDEQLASEFSADDTENSAPAVSKDAASESTDEEKQDASSDAAN